MKLHLTLQRSDKSIVDIAVATDATTRVGDLADAILVKDPNGAHLDFARMRGQATLEVVSAAGHGIGHVLDAEETLGDVLIANGVRVSVVPARQAPKTPVAFLELHGAGSHRRYEIPRGSTAVGRGHENDIVLEDPLVSKKHARVHVGVGTIELIDLNSANGIIVQGRPVERLEMQAGQQALIGGTLIRAGHLPQQSVADPVISEIKFTRSPSVEKRYLGTDLASVEPPELPEPQPFPWLAMLLPLLVGGAMFFVTRSPLSILFVAMSPILMFGTWLTALSARRKKAKADCMRFAGQLERLSERLRLEHERETTVRQGEAPPLSGIVSAVLTEQRSVWTRRPEHWGFTHLRLGVGTVPSRNTVAKPTNQDLAEPDDIAAIEQVIRRYRTVANVPVVENLADAGAIGVSGPVDAVTRYVRGLVAQIAGTRGPTEFVMCGIFGPKFSREFHAMKWLPHAIQSDHIFGGVPFADTAPAASHVLARLEEVVNARSGHRDGRPQTLGAMNLEDSAMAAGARVGEGGSKSGGGGEPGVLPVILVCISDDAPVNRARLIHLLEHAVGAGIYTVWAATSRSRVPAACRTYLELDSEGARASFVRLGMTIERLQTEGLSADEFARFARKLASFIDAGALDVATGDVPHSVSMLSLIGKEMATDPGAIIDRWQQNGSLMSPRIPRQKTVPKLRAIVGQSATGAMHLDLREHGPHALVGGTTGSGKSEFLQSWVLGMAAEYSPQRVTFLFVDYKGGAAFADCVRLPHCVGLVTDLNSHLVRRALASLRAELHFRESLFAQKKVKDLTDLENRGDREAPPALVIVIDEFAALVGEMPEFVDGVVDVAQRGRSLGIHLIMATQRPAGVIGDNLRANTNLRVALRMADEVDSADVIGTKLAGSFDPGVPGRAAAKTGPGRLTVFQSAYAGGWSLAEQAGPQVEIQTFSFGLPERWEARESEKPVQQGETDLGPNDLQSLVGNFVAAARQRGLESPRRPWLDELAVIYDLTRLPQRSDERLVMGVQDVPQRQAQAAVYFEPDRDGHLAVFGAGGSGKSTVLRTLGIAAGITPRGGPVDVYGLDFGAGGLRMLEELPHVGSVIGPDSNEQIRNMFAMLREELVRRAVSYAEANADTITQYRQLASRPEERRILLLIDGFPMFRDEYEGVPGRSEIYASFQQIMSDGRALGIHVALSATRGQSVPTVLQALIQRRVILRMADTDGYTLLGVPKDVLDAESVPGRAMIDDLEVQIGVIGGTPSITEQAAAVTELARTMQRQGRLSAPKIRALPGAYEIALLPEQVSDLPVLGLAESGLGPVCFDPVGLFVVAGGPGSGRTNAMAAIATSLERSQTAKRLVLLGAARSPLSAALQWHTGVTGGAAARELLESLLGSGESLDGLAVFIEGAIDHAGSPSERELSSLVRRAKAGECLIVSEGDTSDWQSSFGLMGALKASRRGVILAPDTHDGETVFKTPFPRLQRGEFPAGRAMYVSSGRAARVQLPLVLKPVNEQMSGTYF